jgi:hypothetical protein
MMPSDAGPSMMILHAGSRVASRRAELGSGVGHPGGLPARRGHVLYGDRVAFGDVAPLREPWPGFRWSGRWVACEDVGCCWVVRFISNLYPGTARA